ncbi:hypothetical protein [Lacticaseibacillus absianus]|nr:hypothetical protein [Lacticaseibacillus absianus]
MTLINAGLVETQRMEINSSSWRHFDLEFLETRPPDTEDHTFAGRK